MKFIFVLGMLGVVRLAAADTPSGPTCKASADCGANAVCTAEGKCVQLATPQPTPPPTDPNKPSDADMAEAKKHFDAGVVLSDDGNYTGALAEFTKAWELSREPIALKNMGSAQQQLFLYVEALESLQTYVKLDPNAPDINEINKTITQLLTFVADIKLAITPKDGVTIIVDGKEVGTIKDNMRMVVDKGTPVAKPLRIASGSRTIELTATGYEPYKQTINLTGGAPYDLKADLKLIPTTGKVRITSPIPRAMVSIDGQPIGPVPLETELKGGGHTLEVTAPDYQPYRGELVVTPGAPTREVPIALDKVVVIGKAHKPWYKKWYVVAPLGAVVVGGGVGAYLATRPPDPVIGTLAPGSGTIK